MIPSQFEVSGAPALDISRVQQAALDSAKKAVLTPQQQLDMLRASRTKKKPGRKIRRDPLLTKLPHLSLSCLVLRCLLALVRLVSLTRCLSPLSCCMVYRCRKYHIVMCSQERRAQGRATRDFRLWLDEGNEDSPYRQQCRSYSYRVARRLRTLITAIVQLR